MALVHFATEKTPRKKNIEEEIPVFNYLQLAYKHKEKLKAILGRVLLEIQKTRGLLVIYEKKQTVYHVTVL